MLVPDATAGRIIAIGDDSVIYTDLFLIERNEAEVGYKHTLTVIGSIRATTGLLTGIRALYGVIDTAKPWAH